ncbi:MAG: DsbA family protein [Beijerinckiaceae bacterium]
MHKILTAAACAGALAFALPAAAQAPAFNDAQRGAIHEIIKDYLLKNPEVIQEALGELDRRQKEGERQARLKITQDKSGPLFSSKHSSVFGNPNGDVTIVEFFDYNCGFCKRALGDLQRMVNEDKNVKVVVKDFPVLGQGSVEAATVALAAKQQLSPDKIWAFHQRLLSVRGQVGRQQALDTAKEVGADMARLQKDMESPAVRAAIEENVQIADSLGLTGTPSYVVGDEIVVGAVGFAELKGRIDNVRKCGKAAC